MNQLLQHHNMTIRQILEAAQQLLSGFTVLIERCALPLSQPR